MWPLRRMSGSHGGIRRAIPYRPDSGPKDSPQGTRPLFRRHKADEDTENESLEENVASARHRVVAPAGRMRGWRRKRRALTECGASERATADGYFHGRRHGEWAECHGGAAE